MTMASGAQCGVFGPTSRVVLHGSARPMVDGVAEADVCSLAHQHDLAFSRSFRDRRDARQAAQRVIVSPVQSVLSFCEQRGEDNSSHSRQRCEDLRVMLFRLSWLDLYSGRKVCGQNIELTMRVLELTIHKADALDKTRDMSGSRFNRSSHK